MQHNYTLLKESVKAFSYKSGVENEKAQLRFFNRTNI